MNDLDSEPEGFVGKTKRKFYQEPLVPLGMAATVGFLLTGFKAFKNGDSAKSQSMMRWRIIAQGLTIAAMFGGVYFGGLVPHDRPKTMEEKMARLEAGSSSGTGNN